MLMQPATGTAHTGHSTLPIDAAVAARIADIGVTLERGVAPKGRLSGTLPTFNNDEAMAALFTEAGNEAL